MTLSARIIEACTNPAGLSLSEIAQAVGKTAHIANAMVAFLAKEGRLHKSGVVRYYRFFSDKAHSDAWDLVAQGNYDAMMAESKERQRLAKNAKQSTGNAPGRPVVKKVEKPAPKAKRTDLVIVKEAHVQQPKIVKVTWPEHVKIQVAPTPASRFAFDPPLGWKGEITRDWMDRRLANNSANT